MKRNLLIITLLFLGSFVILLLGNIIIIGEKIASLSHVAWAEYAFYTLILVVFYVVVIRPVVRVHRAPQIPALSIDGEWNTAQLVAFGHKLADNCNYIPKDKSCPELRKLHQQRLLEEMCIRDRVDSNGRAARLLMNYIQFCYRLFPAKIFKEDRADYILSLQQSQDEETSQPFLDFMATQLKKSLSLEIERDHTFRERGFSFMF